MQAVNVGKKVVKGAKEPLVQLGPVRGEVLFYKNARNERQLVVGVLAKNAVIRILN